MCHWEEEKQGAFEFLSFALGRRRREDDDDSKECGDWRILKGRFSLDLKRKENTGHEKRDLVYRMCGVHTPRDTVTFLCLWDVHVC